MPRLAFGLLVCLFTFTAWGDVVSEFQDGLKLIEERMSSTYAFPQLKKQKFGWDLNREIERSRLEAQNLGPDLTRDQARTLINRITKSTRDYHAMVVFTPYQVDQLPFEVRGVGNRLFVTAAESYTAMQPGDEIESWDGVSVRNLLKQFAPQYENTTTTDRLHTYALLTTRYHLRLDPTFDSQVVRLRVKRAGRTFVTRALWTVSQKRQEKQMEMTHPWWHELGFAKRSPPPSVLQLPDSAHVAEAFRSVLKPAGTVLWQAAQGELFDGWISETNGKRIGMIRINSFFPAADQVGFANHVAAFEQLVVKMNQEKVDGLILDVRHNFGGSIDYSTALASFFFDRPVANFDFEYRLFPEMTASLPNQVASLNAITDLTSAYAYFGGQTFYGQPVDMEFVTDVKNFYQRLLDDVNAGRSYGRPAPYNAATIRPHATTRYTGPLFVVMNGWSISCGDFFPALFKHHGRAKLIGEQTSGAGGFIGSGFSATGNPLGMRSIRATFAAGRYPNAGAYLENNGPKPDISISEEAADFTQDHKPFSDKVIKAVLRRL